MSSSSSSASVSSASVLADLNARLAGITGRRAATTDALADLGARVEEKKIAHGWQTLADALTKAGDTSPTAATVAQLRDVVQNVLVTLGQDAAHATASVQSAVTTRVAAVMDQLDGFDVAKALIDDVMIEKTPVLGSGGLADPTGKDDLPVTLRAQLETSVQWRAEIDVLRPFIPDSMSNALADMRQTEKESVQTRARRAVLGNAESTVVVFPDNQFKPALSRALAITDLTPTDLIAWRKVLKGLAFMTNPRSHAAQSLHDFHRRILGTGDLVGVNLPNMVVAILTDQHRLLFFDTMIRIAVGLPVDHDQEEVEEVAQRLLHLIDSVLAPTVDPHAFPGKTLQSAVLAAHRLVELIDNVDHATQNLTRRILKSLRERWESVFAPTLQSERNVLTLTFLLYILSDSLDVFTTAVPWVKLGDVLVAAVEREEFSPAQADAIVNACSHVVTTPDTKDRAAFAMVTNVGHFMKQRIAQIVELVEESRVLHEQWFSEASLVFEGITDARFTSPDLLDLSQRVGQANREIEAFRSLGRDVAPLLADVDALYTRLFEEQLAAVGPALLRPSAFNPLEEGEDFGDFHLAYNRTRRVMRWLHYISTSVDVVVDSADAFLSHLGGHHFNKVVVQVSALLAETEQSLWHAPVEQTNNGLYMAFVNTLFPPPAGARRKKKTSHYRNMAENFLSLAQELVTIIDQRTATTPYDEAPLDALIQKLNASAKGLADQKKVPIDALKLALAFATSIKRQFAGLLWETSADWQFPNVGKSTMRKLEALNERFTWHFLYETTQFDIDSVSSYNTKNDASLKKLAAAYKKMDNFGKSNKWKELLEELAKVASSIAPIAATIVAAQKAAAQARANYTKLEGVHARSGTTAPRALYTLESDLNDVTNIAAAHATSLADFQAWTNGARNAAQNAITRIIRTASQAAQDALDNATTSANHIKDDVTQLRVARAQLSFQLGGRQRVHARNAFALLQGAVRLAERNADLADDFAQSYRAAETPALVAKAAECALAAAALEEEATRDLATIQALFDEIQVADNVAQAARAAAPAIVQAIRALPALPPPAAVEPRVPASANLPLPRPTPASIAEEARMHAVKARRETARSELVELYELSKTNYQAW